MVSLLVSLTYTFLFFVSSVFTPTIQLISIISLILFATNVGLLARNSFAALLRYLFVVVMLFFGIFSSVVIDFNQGAFLPEIGKTIYLNHSVAALFGIYASLILNILCFRFSPNIFNYDSITMPHSLNQLFINVFNKSLFLIPFLGATLFLLEGLPFFLGLSHRLNFYNTVSSFWNTFFILLDLCSVLLGYLYYKNGKDYTWQFLIVILLIRILSLQKFTELILSITLFLSFAALRRIDLRKNALQLLFGGLLFAFSLGAIVLLATESFGGVGSRIMAQSQMMYYISHAYEMNEIRFDELSNEFQNFWGSNIARLELFSQGVFYGIFKLMELAGTKTFLLVIAINNASASGSVPIVFIYYFGYLFAFFLIGFITLILKYIYEMIIYTTIKNQNPFILVMAFLVMIKILKFFVIGSPSFLFNKQIFIYTPIIFLFGLLNFRKNN